MFEQWNLWSINNWDVWKNMTQYQQGLLGGIALAVILLIMVVVGIVLYIYFASAWYAIAKRMKHRNAWLAWIPIANIALWLQMGGFHWAWIFLLLIPFVGFIAVGVLFIISSWRVFERLRYPGWLALAPLLGILGGGAGFLAYAIVIGIVAWRKR